MKEFYSKNAEYPESEGAFPLLIIFDLLVRDNHCQLLYQIPSTMPLDRGTLRNNFDSRSTVPYLSNTGVLPHCTGSVMMMELLFRVRSLTRHGPLRWTLLSYIHQALRPSGQIFAESLMNYC